MVCGQKGKILEITDETGIRRRLEELGFIDGSEVECLMSSPLGDPTAYLIRGAVIALRSTDAKSVKVEVSI